MFTQDHLSLSLVRLKPSEEWLRKGAGLSFVFMKGGGARCVCGPILHRLSQGDVLVMNEALGAKLCAPDSGETVFWSFSLNLEHLFPLFASSEISLLQNVIENLKSAKVYPASAKISRECHALLANVPPRFNLDHRSQLLRVGASILTEEFNLAQPQRGGYVSADEHMLQVFERLSSAELLSLSVGELADKFGYSRRHLNRLFHQHFGVSVASLRMEMRLLKAVSLLRDPNAKVIRVAEECGFNHLGLFNTCFRRRFGTSPGKWRKSASPATKPMVLPTKHDVGCPLQISGLCPMSGAGAAKPASQPKPLINL
jgi:AraC-like DNA-binding protein